MDVSSYLNSMFVEINSVLPTPRDITFFARSQVTMVHTKIDKKVNICVLIKKFFISLTKS